MRKKENKSNHGRVENNCHLFHSIQHAIYDFPNLKLPVLESNLSQNLN